MRYPGDADVVGGGSPGKSGACGGDRACLEVAGSRRRLRVPARGGRDHHCRLLGAVASGVVRVHAERVVRAAGQSADDARRSCRLTDEHAAPIELVADDTEVVGRRCPCESDARRRP